jgi:transcriptional regulator with GAF, ATPase, and Fis domain
LVPQSCRPSLQEQERDYIQKALAFTNHQAGESARILELPRTTLSRKMKKFGQPKT